GCRGTINVEEQAVFGVTAGSFRAQYAARMVRTLHRLRGVPGCVERASVRVRERRPDKAPRRFGIAQAEERMSTDALVAFDAAVPRGDFDRIQGKTRCGTLLFNGGTVH